MCGGSVHSKCSGCESHLLGFISQMTLEATKISIHTSLRRLLQ